MGDANGAIGPPPRLERKGRIVGAIGFLDAEIVPQIDLGPVSRPGAVVAAIIGPHQTDAGVVMVAHGPAVGRLLPRVIAEAHALALGARCADQLEHTGRGGGEAAVRRGAPRQREAEPLAVRTGLAQRFVASLDAEIVQQHSAGLVRRVWFDRGDADAQRRAVHDEHQHRARKLPPLLDRAIGEGGAEGSAGRLDGDHGRLRGQGRRHRGERKRRGDRTDHELAQKCLEKRCATHQRESESDDWNARAFSGESLPRTRSGVGAGSP